MSSTYIAVALPDGSWTIEWSVQGVVLGHVAGTFRCEMEALIVVYERTRADLMRWLQTPSRQKS
jgi:hypothetical protein